MPVIEVQHLTKSYGAVTAVNDLSFSVAPGQVTGFLGPNGSGKSTTMRMMIGLDAPSAGQVTVGGRRYGRIRFPLSEVGALLDANAMHPGRTARNHLLCLAQADAIGPRRVDEVLETVGLADVAHRRTGTFSLGMGQRLGIAAALLGDPAVLLFDEPINGLDPAGILWVRHLLRSLADEGRTVLVSSHLMSEMALTADHLVIIGRGRLLASGSVSGFVERSGHCVRVTTPETPGLTALLRGKGATVTDVGPQEVSVTGLEARDVGILACAAGITLYELRTQHASLEDAFLELTREQGEYQAVTPTPTATA